MTVAINDEGQTGIKEVSGPVPTEEKIYAVRYRSSLEINYEYTYLPVYTTGHEITIIYRTPRVRRLDNNRNVHRDDYLVFFFM